MGYGARVSPTVITALGDDLWIMDGDPLRFLGIPFPTRSVLVRLSSGSLWIHSPVASTPERVAAMRELGEVAHIVAPNKFHHLYVGPWQEECAEAKTWAGPGLIARNKGARFDAELGDVAESAWADELDQVVFGGSRLFEEVVFFHRRSRTLIVTDVLQNHDPAANSAFWRMVKRAIGVLGPKGGVPRDWRMLLNDRDAARQARDRVLAWDFDRLVMSHGETVETGAHTFVEQAFGWLG